MGSLDKDSLFSLELVADSISLSKEVNCRFPAIAFRLLDFPTLIIYHVEPDLGEAIKKKIRSDPYYQAPAQFAELQDKNGLFQVKKGKSCLFKVAPDVLLSHLHNTPMYVMLIDTHPTTPKLVGNSTVPLDVTMTSVYNDIKKLGLSVPTSHGEKGSYKIFNLMGVEIGRVTFGFRILSLGVGLMSHIPDKSIVKMGQKTTVQKTMVQNKPIQKQTVALNQSVQKPMEQEAADIILQDLETVDQNIQVVLSAPRPAQSMMQTQTELDVQKVVATQTEVQKKLRKERKKINRYDNLETLAQETTPADDLFITNIVCPPAMFYNSYADPPEIAPGLTFDDYIAHKKRDAMKVDSDTESIDSDSTIRHEDRFSDSEFDVKPVQKIVHEQKIVQTKKVPTKKPTKPAINLGAMADFPLLSALMSEIVSLQGVPTSQGQGRPAFPMSAVPSSTSRGVTPRTAPSSSRKPQRMPSPTRTVMLRQAASRVAAQRGSSTEETSQVGSPRRPLSAKPPTVNKGWLSKDQRPPVSRQNSSTASVASSSAVKKTKIMPGMTNTQRLRLAKTNPQLLGKLEKEERDRVEKFKARRRELGEGFIVNNLDVSTEISKHPGDVSQYDSFARKVPKLDLHGSPKRPVPTPRMSLVDDQITVKELPAVTPRVSIVPTQNNGNHDSARSYIDVHMPTASLDDSDDYSYGGGSDVGPAQNVRPNLGKTYANNLGFPKDVTVQSTENISMQYSDDFEDFHHDDGIKVSEIAGLDEDDEAKTLDPAEALGLRKMVDSFSDEDNQVITGIDAGAELGLRKMTDTYSDDDGLTQDNVNSLGIDAGEALGLRQIVDQYSDDSPSFHSAKSEEDSEAMQYKPKLKMSTSTVKTIAPATSHKSPHVAARQRSVEPQDPGMSSTFDETGDSTAFIRRSEITGSQFSSIESTGQGALDFKAARQNAGMKKPMISPRKTLDRVRTESVSSYAPSDGEMVDPLHPLSPQAEYSDEFESFGDESESVLNVKHMKDAQLAPEAKFGYTWSGS